MALTPTPVCVQNPKTTIFLFTPGMSAGTVNSAVTAGPNGNKIVAITAINSDTAKVLSVWNRLGGVDGLETSFNVPANAGVDGATANANVMSLWQGLPRDNDGQAYFFLEPGNTLGLSIGVTLTVGKALHVAVVHGQF